MSLTAEMTVALAAMQAALHALRVLANRGLLSPKDADESLDGMMQTLEGLPEQWLRASIADFDAVFVEIRQSAAANWTSDDE